MDRRKVCPLPLSCNSRLARAAASQIIDRHRPSATNRTACAAFIRNGGTKVCVNSGRVARNGPTRMARIMTIRYGPIQPQDVVMYNDSCELCLSVTKGPGVSTKRRNDAPTEQDETPFWRNGQSCGGMRGRRQAAVAAFLSGSSSCSETFNWPRPMPTSMSGLVTPWKSLPPVTRRSHCLARSRYSAVWLGCACCSGPQYHPSRLLSAVEAECVSPPPMF